MMNAKKTPLEGFNQVKKKQECQGGRWLRLGVLLALAITAGILLLQPSLPQAMDASPADIPKPGVTARLTQGTLPPAPAPSDKRTVREAAYDKDVAMLTALIQEEKTDASTRTQAAERLSQMIGDHQSELGIEEALNQAGFNPCMVLMQNGSLTVMVSAIELTGEQSVTILSLCAAHTDIGVENIRIMLGEGA